MNISRYFYKASLVGNIFSKNQNTLEAILTIFQRSDSKVLVKNVCINYYSTYSETSSLVKQKLSLPKKRLNKKKKQLINEEEKGLLLKAFCTAEEYNLEKLSLALQDYTAFKPTTFGSDYGNSVDVVHAQKISESEASSQDVFFFRKGCVVLWNVPDFEAKQTLNFLKPYENSSLVDEIVQNESEIMTYLVSENTAKSQIVKGDLILSKDDNLLEKYTISNAVALSVGLGADEATLEKYIDSMEPVTEDLKAGNRIKMSRNEVLQKTGQLLALRHNINLNSDLLDTPDFYWDREELETLYQTTFNYYCISKRTKVINEKINHCIELVDLLSSHLNDKHHIRLEWMIIILIMVEVAFEVLHYFEYYVSNKS